MKTLLLSLLILLPLLGGCKKASFKSIDGVSNKLVSEIGKGNGEGAENEPSDGDGKAETSLIVTVPVKELPFGGKTTQATARMADKTIPSVDWTVTAAVGNDPGTISPDGVYTSPKTGVKPYTITITATLQDNPSVSGSVPLKIIPSKDGMELIVTIPVPELKVGGEKTTAVATLKNGTKNPPVTWTVSGPADKEPGKIDVATGVYTSPLTGKDQFAVIITATLIADPTVKGSSSLAIVPSAKPMLIVTLPTPQVKVGGKEVQATAVLSDGTKNPPVKWIVMGPAGKDPGTIGPNGVYTSPATGTEKFPVIITAILVSDPTVMSSAPLDIIPEEVIFARCTKANVNFPIVADVYQLPVNIAVLPTDWKTQVFKTTVCMDQYDVPERDFTAGFPDVPDLFEWFGLNTRTALIAPLDGLYTFRLTSDDGAKIWIDDKLLIDNDGNHQTVAKEAPMELKAGSHTVTLDYFQGPMYKIALILEWKKPGDAAFTVVPKTAFK